MCLTRAFRNVNLTVLRTVCNITAELVNKRHLQYKLCKHVLLCYHLHSELIPKLHACLLQHFQQRLTEIQDFIQFDLLTQWNCLE